MECKRALNSRRPSIDQYWLELPEASRPFRKIPESGSFVFAPGLVDLARLIDFQVYNHIPRWPGGSVRVKDMHHFEDRPVAYESFARRWWKKYHPSGCMII